MHPLMGGYVSDQRRYCVGHTLSDEAYYIYALFWKSATPARAWTGFASKNSAMIALQQNPINILTNFFHVDLVFTDDVECFRNNFRCQFIDL